MVALIDLTGHRSGRLEAVRYAGNRKWECRCDCGSFPVYVPGCYLRDGQSRSCGCLQSDMTKARNHVHGLVRTYTYRSWHCMRARAFNHPHYKGVSVCERWNTYTNFLADMGERPEGMTLDRIDPAGDYEPNNCRWATWTVQCMNRRKAHFCKLTHVGVTFRRGSFNARISYEGQRIDLGYFKDEELAGLAYETAKDRYMRLGFVRYFKR